MIIDHLTLIVEHLNNLLLAVLLIEQHTSMYELLRFVKILEIITLF